jgi:ATP-dependent DNA ligase
VLDGEVVVAKNEGLDFEALQLRIHPAASRVKLLSQEIPASVVFFDLLCEGDRDLRPESFVNRRKALEYLLASAAPPIHLTPATSELIVASDWFGRFEGAGLDGVVAKPLQGTYESDKRVMLKVKHERDCDCVVAGFRWHKKGERTMIGSLLLGLFDASGVLQHVGVCASFSVEKRLELVEFLAPYRKDALASHPWKGWAEQEAASDGGERRMPGGQSRWSQGKDLSWEPLRPELVVEVAYEHMQGARFRHMSHFRRWRTDKKPSDCTYAQLETVPPQELMAIFASGR